MKIKPVHIAIGAGALLLLSSGAVLASGSSGAGSVSALMNQAGNFTAGWEGFSATPYWDVSRYSWGYGTPAPGATGTISQSDAFNEMVQVLQNNYNTLSPQVTRMLTANQWTAFLDFSYELGVGDAQNLLAYMNAGDDSDLNSQWMAYVNVSGSPSSELVARRTAEWQLWQS